MRDLIDERNYREKCARSIVKSYNVNYILKPEEESPAAESPDENKKEAPAAKKPMPLEEDDRWADIPSSGYGKIRDNDPVTEEQIQKILGERQESLFDTLADQVQEG